MKISLHALKELIIANPPKDFNTAYVQETWIDFGAGWKEDTIIVVNNNTVCGSYQALCPRDLKMIKDGTFTEKEANKFLKEMQERGW